MCQQCGTILGMGRWAELQDVSLAAVYYLKSDKQTALLLAVCLYVGYVANTLRYRPVGSALFEK